MCGSKRKQKWSELCPEMLRCVFERLSLTDLNRAKSVCSSWHSASRGCVPKRNEIPWLILFPRNNENKSSCLLFVPYEREKVYKTRDLGSEFVRSTCLATYGSWLLMMDTRWNLNILNPLTGEIIDLALTNCAQHKPLPTPACLWIDHTTKDYLVVCKMEGTERLFFTKKGINTWRRISPPRSFGYEEELLVYEHKSQKLYAGRCSRVAVKIWCLSGDEPRQVFEHYAPIEFAFWDFLPDRSKDEELYLKEEELYVNEYVDSRLNIAVSTVSGQLLKVACAVQKSKRWLFCVYKMHPIDLTWQVVDSLGDETLILDMGITVVAKDIPGIKRNSIYFSGLDRGRKNPDHIFVFDLTTHKIEPLPQCVFSSFHFSDARWFFPGLGG